MVEYKKVSNVDIAHLFNDLNSLRKNFRKLLFDCLFLLFRRVVNVRDENVALDYRLGTAGADNQLAAVRAVIAQHVGFGQVEFLLRQVVAGGNDFAVA